MFNEETSNKIFVARHYFHNSINEILKKKIVSSMKHLFKKLYIEHNSRRLTNDRKYKTKYW